MDLHSDVVDDTYCWICQSPVDTGGPQRVQVNSVVSLPIHRECWMKMSPDKRAEIAYSAHVEFRRFGSGSDLIKEILQRLATSIGRDFGDWTHRQN